ncbi:MAG: SDR family oxidoreductase [Armatimonadetes bacterium]|nr:SDR family oxidoreductase [Armatimonadota bacterium]
MTGGGKGIGRGTARVLASEGATVIVAGKSMARLEEAARDIRAAGGQAAALFLDITDQPGVAALVRSVTERFGGIDVLVNNAGLMPMPDNLVDFDDALRDELFRVNATGTYNMTKAALPQMIPRQFGRIINISSASARLVWPDFAACGAAKGALHAFTTALAKEVASSGITVNCILPGFTRTEEMERIWGEIGAAQRMTVDKLVQPILDARVPMKRWMQPEEIGYTVSFLASRRADTIAGQLFTINGGLGTHD